MNSTTRLVLASGLAALFAAGGAWTEEAPPAMAAAEQPDDGAITAKVKDAIKKDAALGASNITVETVQGEVRLNGTVGSPADVQKATALAFGVAGVKKVQNNLKSE